MNLKKIEPFVFPVLIVLVFFFSIIGFKQELGDQFHLPGVLFAILNFFIMNDADPVEVSGNTYILIAKYLAAVLVGLGLFSLSFKFLRAFIRANKVRFTFQDHIVVFSLDPIAKSIITQLLQNGYKVVVVESDKEHAELEEMEERGALIIQRNPFEKKTLEVAGLAKARMCILAHNEDITNVQIASKISSYIYDAHTQRSNEQQVLKILMHIDEHENIDIIKDYFDINNSDEHYDLQPFSINQMAAQRVFDTHYPHQYVTRGEDDKEPLSIAMIGCSKATEFFLLENIILSSYDPDKLLRIYLVGQEVEQFYHEFRYQYPFYDEYVDLIPVKLLNANFFANFAWSKEHIEQLAKVKVAYFFGESDSVIMNTAAAFRQFLYAQTLSISQVPLVITLPEDSGVYDFLNENEMHRNEVDILLRNSLRMHFIRRQNDTFSGVSLVEESAMTDTLSRIINFYYSICYEFSYILKEHFQWEDNGELIPKLVAFMEAYPLNREEVVEQVLERDLMTLLSKETGIAPDALMTHCSIRKRWNTLNNRKKDSNRYAARNLPIKLFMMERIGCWPVNRENIIKFYPFLAKVEHRRWSAEKMVFNYKHGPFPADKKEKAILKDVLKIHDQLIAYDKLTEGEKQKDLNLFLLMPLLFAIRRTWSTRKNTVANS